MNGAIIITGGLGYIGSHTAVLLAENGYEVVLIDNLSHSNKQVLVQLNKILGERMGQLHFYNEDIRNKEALAKIFKNHNTLGVIHLAAYKSANESISSPLNYYNNNLISTIHLLEVMAQHQVFNLVFSSSATVYGDVEKMPLDETRPTKTITPYANTKLWTETILTDLHQANPNWNLISLRYFNPIGAHQSGELGENPLELPNNLLPFLSQVAIGKQEKLAIYGTDYPTPDGTCIRDYIHICDLTQGHLAAIKYLQNTTGMHTIINLGSGRGYSVLDMVKTFETIIGFELPKDYHNRRSGDVPIAIADTSKAKQLLNWEPKNSLEDMCQDSWNWQQQFPDGFISLDPDN